MTEVSNGLTKVSYEELGNDIRAKMKEKGISAVQIAAALNLKSTQTISNIWNDKQIVSDDVLSKVFNFLDLKALITYDADGRSYFIEK